MKISFISKTAIPSNRAESIFVMQMCQAYSALGHEVTLLVPDHPVQVVCDDVFSFYGIRHRFTIQKVRFPRWCPDLISFGMQMPFNAALKRSDLIHSRSVAPAWGAVKFFQIPTIYEIHTAISENQRQRKLFASVTSSNHLKAIVVLTASLADHVRSVLSKKDVPIIVASDAVESSFLEANISKEMARKQLNLSEEKRPVVVYTGHLYPGRGIELILGTAQNLRDHLFLIVGGREEDIVKYKEEAKDLDNVFFAGFKPPSEVFWYLAAADALLMPYKDQVQVASGGDIAKYFSPMKMFQYMAAERPILSSNLPVLQEILHDRVNALLLPNDDILAWTGALRALQADPALAGAIAHRARKDVESHTWEQRVQTILDSVAKL